MPKSTVNRTSGAELMTARSEIKWEWASAAQYKAFISPPGTLCLSGGFGAGKTLVAMRKIILLCDLFPGSRWVVLRSSFEHLKRTTMPTFFGACPPEMYDPRRGGKRVDSDKYVQMINGSTVLWMHLDHPDSIRIVKGLEPNGFVIDQAEDISEGIFDLMLGRLGRWKGAVVPQELMDREPGGWKHFDPTGKPIPPSYAILTVNPETKLHWIYKRFHPDSKHKYMRVRPNPDLSARSEKPLVSFADLGYDYISMPSTENRFLAADNLGQLLSKDEAFQQQFVYDVWGAPKGKIHTVSELSKIPYDPVWLDAMLRRSPYKYRVLDHGDSAPTCVTFWFVDHEGNLFCYKEYYEADKLISAHRRDLKKMSDPYVFTSIADPAIFNKTMQNKDRRYSVADEYSDVRYNPDTAIVWLRGSNEELGTRERIQEYLAVDPTHKHPITKKLGSPRIFFIMKDENYPEGCEVTVDELESQRREKLPESVDGEEQFSEDRDDSVPDHAYDTIRYMVGWRPSTPRRKEDMSNPHGTFDAMMQHEIKRMGRQGFRNPQTIVGVRR